MKPLFLLVLLSLAIVLFAQPAAAQVVCGDSVIGVGEECDDGDTDPDDGCSATCQYEVCAYPDLVGYWTFDTGVGNAAHDYSPTGNDGTLMNMDNSNWVPGHVGSWALEFTGGDFATIPVADQEYVELLGLEGGPLDGLTAYSLEAWVNFDSASDGDPNADAFIQLNSINYASANNNLFYLKRGEDDYLDFSTADNAGVADHLDPSVSLNDNQWYHVVAVWDGAEKIIYVDGAPIGSRAWAPAAIAAVESPLLIGADKDRPGGVPEIQDFFDGTIDNVAVFDRALTDIEVTAHSSGMSLCEPNTVPTADAGGPYAIVSPAVVIALDGSGSVDAEGPMTYEWVIANGASSANCELSASGVMPSINCTSVGSATATLTVTDSGGLQATDNAAIVVTAVAVVCGDGATTGLETCDIGVDGIPGNADDDDAACWGMCQAGCVCPALASSTLFSVAIDLEPISLEEGHDLDVANVIVTNNGSDPGDARLRVRLLDPVTRVAERAPASFMILNLAAGASSSQDIIAWVNASALSVKNYLLVADVYEQSSGDLHSSNTVVLSVIRSLPSTTAVPELDGILLPLIGISVVLMLFFASKKKQ